MKKICIVGSMVLAVVAVLLICRKKKEETV